MNLENKLSRDELKQRRSSIKKIFFYRVCGTGMGALASLLVEKGFTVEGGDNLYFPPMSTYLKSSGIMCHKLEDLDHKFFQDFDLIIVGNVVSGKSENARFIESLGISFCSFPAALGAFVLSEVNVVGIAGTHGKTTTTYLMLQVFEKLGERPGYFIGGVLKGRPSAQVGDGKYFFIESDEYDSAYFEKISKFRLYFIKHLILTSLEFDHADIFNDIEDIKNEFKAILPLITGEIIYNDAYLYSRELLDEAFPLQENRTGRNFLNYGNEDNGPYEIKMNQDGSHFKLKYSEIEYSFQTDLVGIHNILNLTSVIFFALKEGFSYDHIFQAVFNLEMVKRRQEVKGQYHGAIVIDDFAHHPRAIQLTIEGIQTKYPQKKIITIFGPHSATMRSSLFFDDLTQAFKKSDEILILSLQSQTTLKDYRDLDIMALAKKIEEGGTPCRVVNNLNELRSDLDLNADEKKLFLFLTNGSCMGLWESDFINELQ